MADMVPQLSQADILRLVRDGWKLTPATFAHKISQGAWIPAEHLKFIAVKVAQAVQKGRARLLISVPPRHGKSELISVYTPPWILEHHHDWPVMLLSYGMELSTDFSFRVRTMLTDAENEAMLSVRVLQERMRIERFLTTALGSLTAAGIGGVITGRGAKLMIIDDYIKNAEDALSVNQRNKAWEWFKSTAFTRLEPGGNLIIVATRWDQDDLIGRCIKEMPQENWEIINLPAIAGENDPMGRKPGEPLWPERYPVEELQNIKAALGSYWFDAMYQQNPRASMSDQAYGSMVKVIEPDALPHRSHLEYHRAWDLAASEEKGDWSAGPLIAIRSGDRKEQGLLALRSEKVYILDLEHFRKGPHKTELRIAEVAESDGHGVRIWMEQEPGAAGKSVIENYETKVLKTYAFTGERVTGKIEVRAQAFLAAVEAGNVYMVKAPWNEALRNELNGFPTGEHDDIVSALALAYNKAVRLKYKGVTWGRTAGEAGEDIDPTTGMRNRVTFGRRATHRDRYSRTGSKRPITGVTW